ncbi:hypothetical protein ACLS0M_10680 [Avibacterium avium]
MLELMDKSKTVRRFMWAVLFTVFVYLLLSGLPNLINAFAQWQQLTNQ